MCGGGGGSWLKVLVNRPRCGCCDLTNFEKQFSNPKCCEGLRPAKTFLRFLLFLRCVSCLQADLDVHSKYSRHVADVSNKTKMAIRKVVLDFTLKASSKCASAEIFLWPHLRQADDRHYI